jgi:hypothetical protein
MNKNNLITLGAIGLLAYFLLRRKKSAKEIGQSETQISSDRIIQGIDNGTVAQTTATLRARGVSVPRRKLIRVEDIRVPVKEPIYVPARNAIPNLYATNVGQPVSEIAANANQEGFYNLDGGCTENIQKACGCASENNGKYKLDIPNLP